MKKLLIIASLLFTGCNVTNPDPEPKPDLCNVTLKGTAKVIHTVTIDSLYVATVSANAFIVQVPRYKELVIKRLELEPPTSFVTIPSKVTVYVTADTTIVLR